MGTQENGSSLAGRLPRASYSDPSAGGGGLPFAPHGAGRRPGRLLLGLALIIAIFVAIIIALFLSLGAHH
jgi:hypothetical protein